MSIVERLNPHQTDGRKKILVVDDEPINREILERVLRSRYEILTAENGKQALEMLRSRGEEIDLVMLDLSLPDMSGIDFLRKVKEDRRSSGAAIIVMIADLEHEVECLTTGVMDYITKPFPTPTFILAVVQRAVEIREMRRNTEGKERDPLTGFYNKEFFDQRVEEFDELHGGAALDAVYININRFHLINERYGREYGDEVLRRIAGCIGVTVTPEEGVVCRWENDTFLIYCLHREDYKQLAERITVVFNEDGNLNRNTRLRMGVYPNVEQGVDVERRFDRARKAAKGTGVHFTHDIAFFNNALLESEVLADQLLDDFYTALKEHQFLVYYQPKFDIRPSQPVLSSAEALVRWEHPDLGMISPSTFIPLFEDNGLIQDLDRYVWKEAASQICRWKKKLGISVPVSVNVSRVDLYEPDVVEQLLSLVKDNGLSTNELILEITESAYTQDTTHIVETVKKLRSAGFQIEMDDFGTGYSSLNIISKLPIDALKLDMQFVRNGINRRKDLRVLEMAIGIADSLNVPTIAEGVETAEQMFALKAMGCYIIQGYYFSRPVNASEFEIFLLARKSSDTMEANAPLRQRPEQDVLREKDALYVRFNEKYTYDSLHDPLTGLYNNTAYDILMQDSDPRHIAVFVAVIDHYDTVRSAYSVDVVDRLVCSFSESLKKSFRSVDHICRLSNSMFVVIMSRVDSTHRELVREKAAHLNEQMAAPGDGLPSITISVGVAFGDRENPQGDLFHDARVALSKAHDTPETRCVVY